MAIRINDKITFIHIGKNAGTSISRLVTEKFKTQFSEGTHDTFRLLPESWQENCFCVIRNPYDRLLSLYHFTIKKMTNFYKERKNLKSFYEPQLEVLNRGFENFVLNEAQTIFYTKPTNMDRKQTWSEKNQIRFFPEQKSQIKIIRFEHLQSDWEDFCKKEELQYFQIPKINSSRDDNKYREFYTQKMKSTVESFWWEDIELGGYEF